jgi:hypothetical protein
LGYGLPQNYPRFRIHFDNALVTEVFLKGNLMPTYSKWICENQQLAFEASQIETTEMIEVQLVNSVRGMKTTKDNDNFLAVGYI